MGLLDRIEREREQQRLEEVARNQEAESVRQGQIVKEDERIMRNGRLYIEEAKLIAQLLDSLKEFGYVDYLHAVREGIRCDGVLFMSAYYPHQLDELKAVDDWSSEFYVMAESEKSTVLKQQRDSRHALLERISKNDLFPWEGMRKIIHPDEQFFGDLYSQKQGKKQKSFWVRFLGSSVSSQMPQSRFSEPKEIGIGLRFGKASLTEDITVAGRTLYGPENHHIVEWIPATRTTYNAFYVRLRNPHLAVITGVAIQEEVDFSDIKMFDEALGQVAAQPFSSPFALTSYYPPSD